MPKITASIAKSIKPGDQNICIWDDSIKGFFIRQQKNSVSYCIKYRNKFKKQRIATIGKASKITIDQARKIANEFFFRLSNGIDPLEKKEKDKNAMNISELCDWYLKEGTLHKKESTRLGDKSKIERHIKPLIGSRIVESINRGDIEKLIYDISEGKKIFKDERTQKHGRAIVKGGPGAARRTFELLGSIFEFAIARNIIEKNPCWGIKKAPTKKRDIFLTPEGIRTLGTILNDPKEQAIHLEAINILKLLLLTGCRRGEILSLRWEYVDFRNQCFRFPDTKTGAQNRPFGLGALHLLNQLYHDKKEGWVFPSKRNAGHYVGLPKAVRYLKKKHPTKIRQDLTIHALRHTYSSIAADICGFSEFTIAGLLGHHLGGVTSRYTHNIDKALINAADRVSLIIEGALTGLKQEESEVISIARVV